MAKSDIPIIVFATTVDIVVAAVGVIFLALIFSHAREWFKVSNELDWIAALIFFFGIRIGNRLEPLDDYKK
jgi:hypothetical protein